MSDTQNKTGGWTFFRGFWFVIGILIMAGFGFCSLCGIAIGGGSDPEIVMVFILPGLGLAFLGFLLARWMYLKRKSDGPDARDEKPWRH